MDKARSGFRRSGESPTRASLTPEVRRMTSFEVFNYLRRRAKSLTALAEVCRERGG